MRPLTVQGRQRTDGSIGSSISALGSSAQHCLQERGAVVVNLMYPSGVPKPGNVTSADLPHLPPGVVNGRRSTDVIFYDPIPSNESGELAREPRPRAPSETPPKPEPKMTRKGSGETRREAIDAVVRELARLSMKRDLEVGGGAAREP